MENRRCGGAGDDELADGKQSIREGQREKQGKEKRREDIIGNWGTGEPRGENDETIARFLLLFVL